MRICTRKSDGRIIEAQSGDHGTLDVLRKNAEAAGYKSGDVDVSIVPDTDAMKAISEQDTRDHAATPKLSASQKLDEMFAARGITRADVDAWLGSKPGAPKASP